jgi:hypothetical protein
MRLPANMDKKLTIGMATYDDFDGVFFTIQSLRMYHRICNTDEVEFVVIDTNPDGSHGETVKNFVTHNIQGRGKYIPKTEGNISSFNKYEVVNYASGKYVLILDCHVLLKHNAIDNLLNYYWKNPECKNLVQGPLVYDDLENISTHFKPQWNGHMYGTWDTDIEKYKLGEPFEIPMQGMGLLSFERKHWPQISSHFVGFGAEEGYIAEKFRQNGGKNICLPQLGWNHRFGRPNGVKFRLILEDRIYNYFIGWLEITKDPNHEMVKGTYDYFKDLIPQGSIDIIWKNAKEKVLGT